MKLFENKVGRPSNEILKKRKLFYVGIAVSTLLVVVLVVYLLSSFDIFNLKGASYNGVVITRNQTDAKQFNSRYWSNKTGSKWDDFVIKIEPYLGFIAEAASKKNVHPALIIGTMMIESKGDTNAQNGKHCGLMQVGTDWVTETCAQLKDPKTGIFAGTNMLRDAIKRYGNEGLKRVACAYINGYTPCAKDAEYPQKIEETVEIATLLYNISFPSTLDANIAGATTTTTTTKRYYTVKYNTNGSTTKIQGAQLGSDGYYYQTHIFGVSTNLPSTVLKKGTDVHVGYTLSTTYGGLSHRYGCFKANCSSGAKWYSADTIKTYERLGMTFYSMVYEQGKTVSKLGSKGSGQVVWLTAKYCSAGQKYDKSKSRCVASTTTTTTTKATQSTTFTKNQVVTLSNNTSVYTLATSKYPKTKKLKAGTYYVYAINSKKGRIQLTTSKGKWLKCVGWINISAVK